ncbi:hypothetical protein GCM10009555_056010 [Acrocarpospora macrocephala]|uniref:Uncharacterized protein n=1 Tax=Acrocarpospora macrocephala TaxID=150177 RepID=A0A5M3WR08_9ACTN|nr:hypothetical protein Amac_041790 [Acrocarpospora macrocephala]
MLGLVDFLKALMQQVGKGFTVLPRIGMLRTMRRIDGRAHNRPGEPAASGLRRIHDPKGTERLVGRRTSDQDLRR